MSTNTIHITAFPYATQHGTLKVPGNITQAEVDEYIADHWDEIEFDEPELDYECIQVEWEG